MTTAIPSSQDFIDALARVMARAGYPHPGNAARMTGGAMMESWLFSCGEEAFVLRRAPSLEFIAGRGLDHPTEAAIIRAAHDAGITAPEVIAVLEPADGLGSGFVMRALPGTSDPRAILEMDRPDRILAQAAADLARIHALGHDNLPDGIPVMDYAAALAGLRQEFEDAGGDRPIIALGLRWLFDNLPEPVEPVLNHGDYRLGNILCKDGHLTGVLDWELAHFGDPHEDLAFGCMAVWRFARYDRPALGLGPLADWFDAYGAQSGRQIDLVRFRFWLVYRTVWWALGCLRQAHVWRSGEDRMLERVVISRRTSEQELDLLLLLEQDAPLAEREARLQLTPNQSRSVGEATYGEIATAISEWLATMKNQVQGHDRFQLAVACNALGIISRDLAGAGFVDRQLCGALLAGEKSIATPGLLAQFRKQALAKLACDIPKYPALAAAQKQWTGER